MIVPYNTWYLCLCLFSIISILRYITSHLWVHSGLVRLIHGVISVRWYVRNYLYLDDLYGWSLMRDDPREMISAGWSIIDDPCWMIYDGSSERDHIWEIIWAEIISMADKQKPFTDSCDMPKKCKRCNSGELCLVGAKNKSRYEVYSTVCWIDQHVYY